MRGERGHALVESAQFVDIAARHRTERHDAETDFIADDDHLRARAAQRGFERGGARLVLRVVERFAFGRAQQIGQPQRQAIDEQAGVGIVELHERVGECDRRFGERPVRWAARAMMRDALREFRVRHACGRDIGDGAAAVGGEPFGMRAFA